MNRAYRKIIVLLLAGITCILACVCGCNVVLDRSKSTDVTEMVESIDETTNLITPKPTQKPKPTPTPTPPLTPTPVSVYIPREELPDGQLFEEDYYAVLPGEGAYYNVFDCYGKPIDSFFFNDAESIPPTGLRTEKDLAVYYRLNQKDVQTILPVNESEYRNILQSNENGFYQINYEEGQVILYNTEGKHIRTLNYPEGTVQSYYDIVVACYGNETVVSFASSDWETGSYLTAIYFVGLDGTINDTCASKELPNRVDGLLGRKYFLVDQGAWDRTSCDVYDMDGHLVMQNVSAMEQCSFTLESYEASTLIFVSDYYIKDKKTYNASFQAVKRNAVEADGDLIFGVEYDVEGIPCVAEYWKGNHMFYGYSGDQDLVAVGTSGDQMAIKTKDDEYIITCNDLEYFDMNGHVLVLSGSNGSFQVISLETGEVLNTIKNAQEVQVADKYLLVLSGEHDDYGWPRGSYVIDNQGNVRYYAQNTYIECTSGEYIILRRGPYEGIADLNGAWVMKTLSWLLTRDSREMYSWE